MGVFFVVFNPPKRLKRLGGLKKSTTDKPSDKRLHRQLFYQ